MVTCSQFFPSHGSWSRGRELSSATLHPLSCRWGRLSCEVVK